MSVYGPASLGVYQRDGEPVPSCTVFVSRMLTGRAEPRQKRERLTSPEPAPHPIARRALPSTGDPVRDLVEMPSDEPF